DFRPGHGYGEPDTARLARVESARLWKQCNSAGPRRRSVDDASKTSRQSRTRRLHAPRASAMGRTLEVSASRNLSEAVMKAKWRGLGIRINSLLSALMHLK